MSLAHAPTYTYDNAPATGPGRPDSVKRGLTSRRPRRAVENDEYAAFARRVLHAYSRRIAAGDIDALEGIANLAAQAETIIGEAVIGLRAVGYSWADIGARFGITRQPAQQRWGHLA